MLKKPRGTRWTGWAARRPSLLRPFPALGFEELEARSTPASLSWTGAGADTNWGTKENWFPVQVPVSGDSLTFSTLAPAAKHTATNNIPNATFNSITISDSNYTLTGVPMTLGQAGAPGTGSVVVNAGATGNVLDIDTKLGAAAASNQFFAVNAGADLTVTGRLSGTTGATLTKEGTGTLTLSADNSLFTGPILIDNNAGVLVITDANALGSLSAGTTVGTNSSLRVKNVAGLIGEPLILNGPGVANDGALLNLAGSNTWVGSIILDSDATIGASANTTLTISGAVSDTSTGHDLTKEGAGEVALTAANSYRGVTTVNDGTLTVGNALALGASGDKDSNGNPHPNGTVVTQTLSSKSGQLRIADAVGTGFTVLDEALVLNGSGFHSSAPGALYNLLGNNNWAGPVTIGSAGVTGVDVTVGGAAGTDLIISGALASPAPARNLTKLDAGRVILNNDNHLFTGNVSVGTIFQAGGILNVRDSQALGTGAVTVWNNSTLQLEVEAATSTPRFGYKDPTGVPLATARDLWDDSVTHDPNRLQISNPLSLSGLGSGAIGALHSLSGINHYLANVTLFAAGGGGSGGGQTVIGVARDARPGHPTPDASYFVNDYSLTVDGMISGPDAVTLVKRDFGDLILPAHNTYTGITLIQQGWVTVQDDHALGERRPGIGDTVQPYTAVSSGAALHIKPLTQASPPLTIAENLIIAGNGPSHPYAFISGKGALMNLGGNNTWSGDIALSAGAGIGVEQTDVTSPVTSELTVTGSTSDAPVTQTFTFTASGGQEEFARVFDTGATSGTITIDFDMINIPDVLRVYYPPRSLGGTRILDTGSISGTGTRTVTFGPGASTLIEIVMDEGGGPSGTAWFLNKVQITTGGSSSGLAKWGSKRLILQGDGTFTGAVNANEGTLRAQHDTALGQASGGTLTTSEVFTQTNTTVAAAAVLELARSNAPNSGGIAAGIQVWNEHLTLNSAGQQVAVAGSPGSYFTLTYTSPSSGLPYTTAPIPITATGPQVQAALVAAIPPAVLATDVIGTLSVTRSGNVFTVVFGTAASSDIALLVGAPVNSSGGPPDVNATAEVQVSGGNAALVSGNLGLSGVYDDNTWRGPVTLAGGTRVSVGRNSRLSLLGSVDDTTPADLGKRGLGELLLAGASTYRGQTLIDEGIVTIANSRALGAGDGTAATGTVVADNAQLQLQGSLSVSGEALSVTGSGPGAGSVPTNIPLRWLAAGPGPINNGQTPGNEPVTGRVTGTAVDPSDPNVIYISTAGGGAWKTKDGGKTWLPLFDLADPNAPINGGAIALDPSDPRFVVYGTGEANNSGDSYAGTGVYVSQDSGRTWTLLTDNDPTTTWTNPIRGQSVAKIVVEPANAPGGGGNPRSIYVGTSDFQVHSAAAGAPGVWRYTDVAGTQTWFNMTAVVSTYRSSVNGSIAFPNTPGPDDDYRISFPQSTATWSDLQLVYFDTTIVNPNGVNRRPVLYASLGTYFGSVNASNTSNNRVFRTENPNSATPIWYVGDSGATAANGFTPKADNRGAGEFPGTTTNGRITFSVVADPTNPIWSNTTLYAAVTNTNNQALLAIYKSTDGGKNWATTAVQPPNYMGNQGWYDTTIIAADANTVYVGGQTQLYRTTTGGTGATAWSSIAVSATTANGPHADQHAMALDSNNRLILGNDGGVWRFDPATQNWVDLNGTLAITTFNGLDVHPTDFTIAIGASQDNGTERVSNNLAWTHVDDGDGGVVQIDPKNPNNAYHILNGRIRKSTDGGLTWQDVYFGSGLYFPFVVDPIDPNRLVESNGGVANESTDGGLNWHSLNWPGSGATSIALAQYQGGVNNANSNSYDPDRIYISDGTRVWVTTNHGVSWSFSIPGGSVQNLAVDPANRDVVYAVTNGGRVLKSVNGAASWADITGTLPAGHSAWSVVIDPRDNTVYVGTDLGVYATANGGSVGGTWARFGAGLPNVEAKVLVLNQNLNTLTVGTYGRSMYQLFLDYAKADSGAVRAVSGTSVWTGPVTLTGDTVLSAEGTQNVQNGIAAASLNIIGAIGDGGGNYGITKIGDGTITFSGANTYGGVTLVQQGVLQTNNTSALGVASPAANTVVTAGAALEILTDLYHEPVTVNGNGFSFNGHFTGALRNVSNFNTYTGTLTLGTDTTIGVNSGTQLTIGGVPGNPAAGTGSITDGTNSYSFDKELAGTLVLGSANAYDGLTRVVQGALQVQDAAALGTPDVGTQVLDGAQLQISRNAVSVAQGDPASTYQTVVTSEPLELSGTGIFGTGALLNVRGDSNPAGTNNNTWRGPITLTNRPNFAPATTPGATVTLGASDARDTLTIDTTLVQSPAPVTGPAVAFGITKVGAGTVTLARANAYTGATAVNAGTLRIQNNNALGPIDATQMQLVKLSNLTGTYQLQYGAGTTAVLNANDPAAVVQAELQALLGAGQTVYVGETPSGAGKVLTVLFSGPTAGAAFSLLSSPSASGVTVSFPATPVGAASDTVVNAGTLALDGTFGPLDVLEALTLNGDGVLGAGALNNVVGDNAYSGPITIASDTTLGAAAGTTLTVNGLVRDPGTVPVPAGRLRKAGLGTVVFPDAKGYSGKTVIDAGILNIRDPLSLGVPDAEQQTVLVVGTNGTFALTFRGQTTDDLPITATATDVKTALEALPTVGGVGGTVTVLKTTVLGNTQFAITFGGTLANAELPQIVPVYVAPAVATVTDGGPATAEVQTARVTATSGNFALEFNGARTTALAFNATGADVEAALNALPTISTGGGSVTVTATGSVGNILYTIKFGGTLAAGDQPQITSVVAGGTLLQVTTVNNGQEGTVVTAGATLQVQGSMAFTSELVTLNGGGFNGMGALNVTGGNVTWQVPLTLGSDTTISTMIATDSITFLAPIAELAAGTNLDLTGPGTVVYTALTPVTYAGLPYSEYTGTTTVRQGHLVLDQAAGNVILGELVVGDGTGLPGDAVIDVNYDNSIADTSDVTVNADGIFNLSGHTDSVDGLTITGGTLNEGAGGNLTTTGLTMTGGLLTIGAGGQLHTQDALLTGNALIQAGNTVTVTMRDLTMVDSSMTFGTGAALNARHVTMDPSSLTFGDGSTANFTDLDIDHGGITFANTGKLDVAGDVIDHSAAIQFGTGGEFDTNNLTVARSATAPVVAGSVTFGATGKLAAAGAVSFDASTLSFDTGGTASAAGGSLANGSDAGFGDTGTLTVGGVLSVAGGSVLHFANTGTATATGSVLVNNGQVTFGNDGRLAGASLSATTGSLVKFLTNGTLDLGAGTLTENASTISFGDDTTPLTATATTGPATLTGGTVSFGNGAAWAAAGTVTDSNGTIGFGNGGLLQATGAMSVSGAAGKIQFGNDGRLTGASLSATTGSLVKFLTNGTLDLGAGTLTENASTISFGDDTTPATATATTGAATLTGGTVSFGTGATWAAAGAVTDSNGAIAFGDTGLLQATGAVSVSGATGKIQFGNDGRLAGASLSATAGSLVKFLTNGTLDLGAGTLTVTASTVTFGDDTTPATATATTGPATLTGGTVSFGNNATWAVGGGLTDAGGPVSFGTGGGLTVAGNVSLSANVVVPASLVLGNTSSFTTGNVTVTGGSSVSLGSTNVFTGVAVSVTGGTFALGAGSAYNSTGDLTLSNATFTLGASGTGTTQNVGLTGGVVNLGTGATLTLNGTVTATSTTNATKGATTSAVAGPGTLALGNTPRTFDVADGPQAVDLRVTAALSAPATEQLDKTGPGKLVLAPAGGYAGSINLSGGELQVDTSTGPVHETNGSVLSGTGTVGTLTGAATSDPVVGTVSPGGAGTPGILHDSGSVTWGPGTQFVADLASNGAGTPVAGTHYDQFAVAGTIDLGGAQLVGNYGTGILVNDSFTIVTAAGGIVPGSKFQQTNGQDITFIAGQKFDIVYGTNTVTLVKVRADATIGVTAAPLTASTHQDITLTATVTPEAGAQLLPNTVTVTFFIDGNPVSTQFVGAAPYTVTFHTNALPGGFLAAGTHAVHAHLDLETQTFNAADSPLPDPVVTVVTPAVDTLGTDLTIFSPGASAGVKDTVTASAVIRDEYASATYWFEVRDSGNNLVRTLPAPAGGTTAGTPPLSISAGWDGRDESAALVPEGTYTISVRFQDAVGNPGTTGSVAVVVDNTLPAVTPPAPSATLIAPGAVGSPLPPSTNLTGGTATDAHLQTVPQSWALTVTSVTTSAVVRTFTGTGPISAVWDGKDQLGVIVPDGDYTVAATGFDTAGNTQTVAAAQQVTVFTNSPAVALVSGPSPTVYGTALTLTATVTVPAPVANLLNGSPVQFYRGAQLLGTANLALDVGTGTYKAVLSNVPSFDAGTHSDLFARYLTASFLQADSPFATQVVTQKSVTVTAADASKPYGAAVPALAFTVTGLVPGDTAAAQFTGSLATAATTASPVGASFDITQGTLASGNYSIAGFTKGTLTVTKAPLAVTVDSMTRLVNAANPAFTFSVTGLVLGDTAAVLNGLTLTTTAAQNSPAGSYPITASGIPALANYTVVSVTPGMLTVTPVPTSIVVGTGPGVPAAVNVYAPDGSLQTSLAPFPGFAGGVRTVAADFNADGTLDVAVATGPGTTTLVQVYDGKTGAVLYSAFPFDDFTGGAFVAAGDINNDGRADLVITPDEGGGPRVIVIRGGDFGQMLSYFGINDPNFRGGARAGVGDLNGDGFADVAVSAGFQGGPRVSLWDGKALAGLQFKNLTGDFFVFDPNLRNGAYLAVGDVNGDGFADLVAGAGPGGGPAVKVFDGHSLTTAGPGAAAPFAAFFAGDPGNRGGVRVATKTLDGDLMADIVAGVGDGGGNSATAYLGKEVVTGHYNAQYTLSDFPGLTEGVYVG